VRARPPARVGLVAIRGLGRPPKLGSAATEVMASRPLCTQPAGTSIGSERPTDILGVSGRAMLDALVQGTTDPALLAGLARGKLRASGRPCAPPSLGASGTTTPFSSRPSGESGQYPSERPASANPAGRRGFRRLRPARRSRPRARVEAARGPLSPGDRGPRRASRQNPDGVLAGFLGVEERDQAGAETLSTHGGVRPHRHPPRSARICRSRRAARRSDLILPRLSAAERNPRPTNDGGSPRNFDTNFDTVPYHNPSHAITCHRRRLWMATRRILALGLRILGFGGRKKWWTGGELNSRHRDFQSRALPTELPVHSGGKRRSPYQKAAGRV